MGDFLTFRRMITPILIQIFFWLGFLGCIAVGIVMISGADSYRGQELMLPAGILVIIFGPWVIRIICEIMIVIFRINETLTDIRNQGKTAQQSYRSQT
jgi:hypothetical protein